MTQPVIFRRPARRELQEAVSWYEQRRPGLGEEFRLQVEEVIDRLRRTPEVHGLAYRDVRSSLVRGFPYSVYYRVTRSRLVVIAVFHARRDPEQWRSRVR